MTCWFEPLILRLAPEARTLVFRLARSVTCASPWGTTSGTLAPRIALTPPELVVAHLNLDHR